MPKKICGLTLIELMIAIVLMGMLVLGFYSIDLFSRYHVISSDKRAKLQNEISYAIEHMSKYVQQANGNLSRNAIQYYPLGSPSTSATGFRVYIDLRNPQTPADLTDDGYIDYTLSLNTLMVACTANGGTCSFTPATENLTGKIIAGVAGDTIMPESPDKGFYIKITDQGMAVDVGLVGRHSPLVAASPDNPQVSMKTRLISSCSSAN